MALPDATVRELVARLDVLLDELDRRADPTLTEPLNLLVRIYGEALERIVNRVDARTAEAFSRDELISHLMLLHDVHPRPLTERVELALDVLRREHGPLELVGIADGVVRIRLNGSGSGCGSARLRTVVEEAVLAAAPEIDRVVVGEPGFIPADSLRRREAIP